MDVTTIQAAVVQTDLFICWAGFMLLHVVLPTLLLSAAAAAVICGIFRR